MELDRLGARDYILSSNLALRLDGLPRSDQATPSDPGVALYFSLKNVPHCLPCDTFLRVADNIAAIAKHIEATRAIERYGVASIKEMFAGFAALPAPAGQRPWREVLGWRQSHVPDMQDIQTRYRKLTKECHPDNGGTHEKMSELNRARDEALKEVS
ncbi:J domain-containing protein [Microvirga brassicacearum]|uniref:J domain-containing protein n=1 Tax=Microvirga brassicacearum TaxID=2580413 RepID=UPI001FCEAB59|nr:J domain-containing protein [Microvirga brassicacearum]